MAFPHTWPSIWFIYRKAKDFTGSFQMPIHQWQITNLDTLVWLLWGHQGQSCSLLPSPLLQVQTAVLWTPPVCKVNHSDSAVHQQEAGSQLAHCTMSDSITRNTITASIIFCGKRKGKFKWTYSDSLKLELVVEEFENRYILVDWREISGENTLKTGGQVVLPPHFPQTEHTVFAAQKLHTRGDETDISS